MTCEDTRELRFKEGVKTSDRGLENTTPTLGCNEERPQQAGWPVKLLHILAKWTTWENITGAHRIFLWSGRADPEVIHNLILKTVS
jgi:hypothetical protein